MNSQQSNALHKEKIWTRDFILICISNFFIFLGFQMTLPTIPLYVEELGGNDQLIGVVVSIFTFSALLVRSYAGHALETRGRKIVYLTGILIFIVSVGSFGFLPAIGFLFFMRFIQGIGWGFSTTASGTIASDIIPSKRRGEGMGYYGLSGNIALAFGPSLGLSLAGVLSYTQLFMICAILGLIAFLLSSRIRYKTIEKTQQVGKKEKWDFYEKTALKPALLLFFITVTFGGIASFLPLYTAQKGISGIQWYFLVFALALMASRTFAGKIYDVKGHRAIFIPGAILIVAAMILLAWLLNTTVLLIAAVLYGIGFGSVQPALQAWSIENAPKHRRGMANATFFSSFDLGVGMGALLFGQIGHLFGYHTIYLVSAFSVFVSIILYIVLINNDKKEL
ncbi:MFS transporter [Metabacillus halosaccharovorans]|uniref:MFS transporter n=1 Tax=Metabacillus halosaccharovorans TaxID=930124 RepID=UPI00203EB0ED|nr:MFS transporter [Metabacillus halosaccharovorans]MCM3440593.1 MFS transporter [Metabacillus halosaccharovorans]